MDQIVAEIERLGAEIVPREAAFQVSKDEAERAQLKAEIVALKAARAVCFVDLEAAKRAAAIEDLTA